MMGVLKEGAKHQHHELDETLTGLILIFYSASRGIFKPGLKITKLKRGMMMKSLPGLFCHVGARYQIF